MDPFHLIHLFLGGVFVCFTVYGQVPILSCTASLRCHFAGQHRARLEEMQHEQQEVPTHDAQHDYKSCRCHVTDIIHGPDYGSEISLYVLLFIDANLSF